MVPRPRFWIALGASAAVLGAGAYLSQRSGDWTGFSRSGALVVIIGAVLAAWESLRAGNSPLRLVRHVFSRDRIPSETLGLALMALGTLIWAFGDLAALLIR